MLSTRLDFNPAQDSEILATVLAGPAVFLLRGDGPDGEPYISRTANLRRRLGRLLGPQAELSKRLNLRERVRTIEYTSTGSDFESGFLLYKVLRSVFPETYTKRLRLHFAPLVKLHLANEYPRASVTTRMGRSDAQSVYYGPFPSRSAAEKFASDSLDFFKVRRCVEDLHPDPAFPGCIYSEMKMCLAPCFKGCTDDEYRREVSRVEEYFDSGGQSLLQEMFAERDAASAALEFETAAVLHAKADKLKALLGQLPEAVHRIDQLQALIVQPSSRPDSVAIFRVDSGAISGPVNFSIPSPEHAKSQSMESRIQEAMAQVSSAEKRTSIETMEHLAIVKRWCYRSNRIGEIFFADHRRELPMRRIVRGISRVYRGEKPEVETSTQASESKTAELEKSE